MLDVKGLEKSHGYQTIFKQAELSLPSNMNAGLVGINGIGKSTLLAILSGEDLEYTGRINYGVKEPLIGYMRQEMSIENVNTDILNFLKEYSGIEQIEEEIANIIDQLTDPQMLEKYSELSEKFEKIGGYSFTAKAEKLLSEIGLGSYPISTKINTLSGGEKRKLLLIATLLKGGDLLLLDEPTNDLDTKSVEGLKNYLHKSIASTIIISHDKAFLNSVVQKIFEIEDGKINTYSGDYNFYQEKKRSDYQKHVTEYQKQLDEEARIKKTKQELQEKAYNIGNRGNKRDNDKGDGSSKVEKKLNRQAKVIEGRLDRIEKIDKPKIRKPIEINFQTSSIAEGDFIINNLYFEYPSNNKFSLNIPSLHIKPKEKIIISGSNGEGKSTLIKLLLGELDAYKGEIKKHSSIRIGYFSQIQKNYPPNSSPIDYLLNKSNISLTDIHKVLGDLGFDDDEKGKKIGLLSPGKRLRLSFAEIILSHGNFIIFDEPTNHLDVESKEALKKAINLFEGNIILVSHDQEFISDIQANKHFILKNSSLKEIY